MSEGEVSSTEEQGIEDLEEEEAHDFEKEEEPPLFIHFDIIACQDTGNHVTNLLCTETDQNDEQQTFWGESCIEDFVKWLEDLQETSGRKLIVVAHNFKGYDSYFLWKNIMQNTCFPSSW